MPGLMLEALVSQARSALNSQGLSSISMSSPSPTTPRPSVIQLAIKEKAALYAAYIPLFADGGVFIPTTRDYKLGDDVYVLLSLPDDPQRYPVAGKVAWVTPARAAANRTQGVGIRFPVGREVAAAQAQDRRDPGRATWRPSGRPRPSERYNRCSAGPLGAAAAFRPPMFVDSHCHLSFPELAVRLPEIRAGHGTRRRWTARLCICTTLEEFEAVHALAHAVRQLLGHRRACTPTTKA